MPVTVTEMARALQQREAERARRAGERAQRLLGALPDARRLLMDRYGASGVVLFGSLAASSWHDGSDVDLAVEGLPRDAYFAALSDLMALFGSPVDLVRVEDATAGLQERILAEGRRL